jgi:hypothetical protein
MLPGRNRADLPLDAVRMLTFGVHRAVAVTVHHAWPPIQRRVRQALFRGGNVWARVCVKFFSCSAGAGHLNDLGERR